ncbi:MAG: hypothetical protein WKG07_28405 [Hymenobacter sp.]
MPVQPRAQRVAAHGVAFGTQFGPQAPGTVAAGMARKGGLCRRLPRRSGLGRARLPPLVVAGRADAQHAAEHLHGPRLGAVPR